MEYLSFKLSRHQTLPSSEGSALTLIIHLIHLFDDNECIAESKASTIKQAHYNNKDTVTQRQSASLHPTIISPSNIHMINVQQIRQFSPKSLAILDELRRLQCLSWKFQIVPSNFYDISVDERASQILSALSVHYLCKSLLLKNTKCVNNDCSDRMNAKYYLVVFQYNQKLKQQKLKQFVKKLSNKSNKYYKFSMPSKEETYELTGFEYNCVSPIGVGDIPIILSHHIPKGNVDRIWIGSGSVNVKLCISIREFAQKFPHFVADIT